MLRVGQSRFISVTTFPHIQITDFLCRQSTVVDTNIIDCGPKEPPVKGGWKGPYRQNLSRTIGRSKRALNAGIVDLTVYVDYHIAAIVHAGNENPFILWNTAFTCYIVLSLAGVAHAKSYLAFPHYQYV